MKRDLLTMAGLSLAALLLASGPAVAGGEKGVKSDLPSASPSTSGDVKGDVKTDMPSASPRIDDQKTGAPRKAPEQQEK